MLPATRVVEYSYTCVHEPLCGLPIGSVSSWQTFVAPEMTGVGLGRTVKFTVVATLHADGSDACVAVAVSDLLPAPPRAVNVVLRPVAAESVTPPVVDQL